MKQSVWRKDNCMKGKCIEGKESVLKEREVYRRKGKCMKGKGCVWKEREVQGCVWKERGVY